MRQAFLALLFFCVAITGAARATAQTVPAPDPLQGDGRVSAFYTWDRTIPAKPGTMLRTEPLPAVLGLPEAGRQLRILYTSTDGVGGKAPVVVSGALFLPKGTPPAGGWPLVAWAHGTVGVADICAPSWAERSYRDISYLDTWLDQGYAVVATDYQGLGTPGPHPYLNVRVEAYSVLDSIRAALAHDRRIANRIVIIGQSQGGGAAVATAAYASQYATDLNIRGTVATGVPYFGPNVPSFPADLNKVDPGIAYGFYIVLMAQQTDPSLKATDVFQAAALPLFEVSRSACVYSLEDDIVLERLTDATAYLPAIRGLLAKHYPEFMYPTLALKQPLFVGTGLKDEDVNPAAQKQLVKDACAAGTIVESHLYADLDHSQTVNGSLKDSIPFVKRVLAGEPISPVCSPSPQL